MIILKQNLYIKLKNEKEEERKQFHTHCVLFGTESKEFEDMMLGWGLDPKNDINKVTKINNFMYILTSELKEYNDFNKKYVDLKKKLIEEDIHGERFIKDMFYYEFINTEYFFEPDIEKIMIQCGLDIESMRKENILKGLENAVIDYFNLNQMEGDYKWYVKDYERQLNVLYNDLKSEMSEKNEEQLKSMSNLEKVGMNGNLSFRYQMLNRLQSDCDYFLKNGRFLKKFLYFEDENKQLKTMLDLYNSFSEEEKPKWFNIELLNEYNLKMQFKKDFSKEEIEKYNELFNTLDNFHANELDCIQDTELVDDFSNIGLIYTCAGSDDQYPIEITLDLIKLQIKTNIYLDDDTIEYECLEFENVTEINDFIENNNFTSLMRDPLLYVEDYEVEYGLEL